MLCQPGKSSATELYPHPVFTFLSKVCIPSAATVQDRITYCVQSNDPETLQDAELVRGDLIMSIRLLIKARKWTEAV